MSESGSFDYIKAFCRNLGWLTKKEFESLSRFRIAIAGVGGVGGVHLVTLARLGFSKFNIADPDFFEIQNFNRQYGAKLSNLGKNKCDAMKEEIAEINPNAEIRSFPGGVDQDNLDAFLKDVDIYVDGLDLFEINMRIQIFERCRLRGIPVITAAPIGFGASVMVFDQRSMSFERYFGFKGSSEVERPVRFLLGMGPTMMHLQSLVEREHSNILEKKTSSTPAGCHIASGLVANEVIKILFKRGIVRTSPWVVHFDAYTHTVKRSYTVLGSQNPVFKLKLKILLFRLNSLKKSQPA